MSRDTKDQHLSIPMDADDQLAGAAHGQEASRCSNFRRRARVCSKVSPWVSACSCIMVAVGLAVWYLYTKKALVYTESIASQLFEQPIYIVQQLSIAVGWTTLIGVIVVSCLLGVTMFVSLLRTYQLSARLPITTCAAPGKLSYGSYAGFIALLNFCWWLVTVAVSLVMAASLCWLLVAFATSSAVTMGVRYVPDATLPNSAYYTTAKNAVDSLNTYANRVQKSVPAAVAAQPEVDTMNINIKKFVAASKEVPITVCPTTCLNIGSFYDTLRLPTSCVCNDANMLDVSDHAVNAWKTLVHVLAALALMGMGCLWLLMNLSAEYAHARRDMRELPGRSPTTLTRDVLTAIQEAPYSTNPGKKGMTTGGKATPTRDQDTARFIALAGTEFTGVDALPESVVDPAPAVEQPMYRNAYEVYQEAPVADAPAAASPKRRASSPTSRNAESEQPSPSNSRGATLNSTAQRYAAYRLRAAQAAAAKGSPSNEGQRKQWMR